MSRVLWDGTSQYDVGVDQVILYSDGPGVAWNGVISVEEKADSVSSTSLYLDGVKYSHQMGREDFLLSLSAFMYPVQFEPYDGVVNFLDKQKHSRFGLSYRTDKEDGRHKIHLVYNAMATPSAYASKTKSDKVDPNTFLWDIYTVPNDIEGFAPSAHLVVDTSVASKDAVEALEDIIYGTDTTPARLPLAQELVDLFESLATLVIIDNGDGSWTAIGPSEAIVMLDPITFQITWPSVVYIDDVTYNISSL